MNKSKLFIATMIAVFVAAFFLLNLNRYLSLSYLQGQLSDFRAVYQAHPLAMLGAYFGIYVVVTGLSLPGATALTLAGAALFGFWVGLFVISFASSIGATLAMLAARFVLRDWVQTHYGARLRAINTGIEKDGAFYLFALRLVPLFPFVLINLLMGLTHIKTRTFYWVSQIGMLAGTAVYVNVGTQLGQITSVKDIVSPPILFSLALLGLFPLIAKNALLKVAQWVEAQILKPWRDRKAFKPWRHQKPRRFDYNLVVIGAGSAGLVSAYIAAATKAKVALIEKHQMGGDCLNTGCVPSKALIRSAKLLSHISRSKEFGIDQASAQFDFAQVMQRVQNVIKAIEPHDSIQRYTQLGVECIQGTARIISPWSVEVTTAEGKKTLTTRTIVIAAGARPFVPPIPGIEAVDALTSDTVWNLRQLPKRLLVLGGGPIGSELAQAFARLGVQVTQVEMGARIMAREDPEVSECVRRRFESEGIRVLTEHTAKEFIIENNQKILLAEHQGQTVRIAFDEVLVAVGRVANTQGLGLETLGIATTPARTVATNAYLQTMFPNIYACGDVAGPYQFTHTAAHQAWYAAVNALFGTFMRFKADYRVIPWTTFTEPEVARVGLNEQEAKAQNSAYTCTTYGIDDLDRAIADGEAHGFVKVLTKPGTDTILGVTLVGEHAGDLLAEYVLAMKHGLGLNKILGTIHTYPTMAEANKYAAGVWKRSTVTQGQWAFLSAFQSWRRGALGFGGVMAQLSALKRDKRPAYTTDQPS